MPFPPQGDLPNPGTEPVALLSPALAGIFFTSSATGKPHTLTGHKSEILTTRFLASINFLEWLTEPRKAIYLLDYWFITKDIKGYESTARG